MKKISIMIGALIYSVLLVSPVSAEKKLELTIYQVMQRVLDRYPSLKISEMQVAHAAEQRQQVESSLGWILNSSAGITHDLTGLGTPSDKLNVNGAITRQLSSGNTLSLSGGYQYEDSSLSFSPSLPNPAHTTRLDLSYRMPLSQGIGNPIYNEGLITAGAEHELAKAQQLLTRITLADNVRELFYSAVLTRLRIENITQAVSRVKRIQSYIERNAKLGLAEEKDQLQAKAQLDTKLAELSAIQLQWKQQQNALNRLMVEDWRQSLNPILANIKGDTSSVRDLIYIAQGYHPAVKISQSNLNIAESRITSAKDVKKDNLDLVLSIGSRTSDGENNSGTVSEQDWAGEVKIEYKHLFDNKGVGAKYKQALLAKNIALQNIKKTGDDIRYTVSSLAAEIDAAKLAVTTSRKQLNSESLKLKEAERRFKSGRADTAQLIQFQNEFSFAQLSFQNQKVDLHNRIVALQIFTGNFWNELSTRSLQNGVEK